MTSNVHEYEALVVNQLRDGRSLLEIIGDLGEDETVIALCSSILADEKALARSAAQSYRHTNGFSKIVLLGGGEFDWKLRLHLWWPGNQPVDIETDHIHNHRWNFATVLLEGGYRTQEFSLGGDGEQMHRYKYHAPVAGAYKMHSVGADTLECVMESWLPAKSKYLISHKTLHRVSNMPGALTATLVLQGTVQKPFTDVFTHGEFQRDTEDSVAIHRFSSAELAEQLKRFIAHLEGRRHVG